MKTELTYIVKEVNDSSKYVPSISSEWAIGQETTYRKLYHYAKRIGAVYEKYPGKDHVLPHLRKPTVIKIMSMFNKPLLIAETRLDD